MDHRVQLDVLPPGIIFPSEVASRISYDEAKKQLRFSGFMSKSDFDRLSRLHNDYRYQRAIERLFQECAFAPPPESRFSMVKAVVGSIALIAGLAAFALWFRHH